MGFGDRALYRMGHEYDTMLGAFSFERRSEIRVFVNAHDGDPLEVQRSVEHESAHRSLAHGTNFGIIQILFAHASRELPDDPRWSNWLKASVRASWSTYEGIAIARERTIPEPRDTLTPTLAQPRYRDAYAQYQQIVAALPPDLLPWWYFFAVAGAEFSMNYPLRDITASDLFDSAGMRDFLRARRIRPDSRLATLSTTAQRKGLSSQAVRRVRETLDDVWDRFGRFADGPLEALEGHTSEPGPESLLHRQQLEDALIPVLWGCFQDLCPELDAEADKSLRARLVADAGAAFGIRFCFAGPADLAWPLAYDTTWVKYMHTPLFDETWLFSAEAFSFEDLEGAFSDPNLAGLALWGEGDMVCAVPLVWGPNPDPSYDPLRSSFEERRRRAPEAIPVIMHLEGERWLFVNATQDFVRGFASKAVVAAYRDETSRSVFSTLEVPCGLAILGASNADLVRLLAHMRNTGVTRISIVLMTPEEIFVAVSLRNHPQALVVIPSELIERIRHDDRELWEWYDGVSADDRTSGTALCTWGYLVAAQVLAGAFEIVTPPSIAGGADRDS